MKKLVNVLVVTTICLSLSSCFGCDGGSSSYRREDSNYWNSIGREQQLRDAELDDAANMERNARREYMRGGGYTSPDGGKQIHYQGSREQKRDLDMIDEYFNEHGWD